MIFPRIELEPYSYQKHTLPIKLKNLKSKTTKNFQDIAIRLLRFEHNFSSTQKRRLTNPALICFFLSNYIKYES
jgi:hypothetical protein